jgi:hypothetical protein
LAGQQGDGLATGIADDGMHKGLFDSAAAFYNIQVTARALAGSLQPMNRGWSSRRSKLRELIHALKSWLTRYLQKSPRAMADSSAAARVALRALLQFKGRQSWPPRLALQAWRLRK